MHEYQKKRLTEFESRKWLILKDMFWVLREEIEPKTQPQNEEKQEQDPGLQMELSTILIIPRCGEESLKTFAALQTAKLARGCFGRLGEFAVFANHADERLGGAGEGAVAAVDKAEFAPKVDTFDGEQLHVAGFHIVLGKTVADDGEAGISGDETLDHADAGEFHGDVDARTIRAEEFIEHLASEAGAREDEGLLGEFGKCDLGAMRQGVFCADHETQAIFVNVVHLQIRRLDGQRDDADIRGAVLDALEDLVAEVAVDADVHQRVATLKFRKNIGEQIEASGFIGAEYDRALNNVAAVRNDLNGFIAHAKQLFGVLEKNFAGRSQLDGLGGTVQEPGFVGFV